MPPLRLLACFAHPDDEAFLASGILAVCTARGVAVRLLCATFGEEGDICTPSLATRETLGQIRAQELHQSCRVLGIQEQPIMLGYRDSGWGDSPAQYHPHALVQARAEEVIERLVGEIRSFRPHVVVTFEPNGVSGHKDHKAMCQYTTAAFQQASDPTAFTAQLQHGLCPYRPQRLFYVARLQGYRMTRALKLRQVGMDVPLPAPELQQQGVPLEDIHLTLDVTSQVGTKIASICCHRTQIPPDWPDLRIPPELLVDMYGTEHLLRAYPPVPAGSTLPADPFAGVNPED
jgi:LmbE family N-acetylglucosaminyl deacetylase